MPPHSTAKADTAVALVLGGMSVQSAWEQSGQPGKTREAGQRNIRSRVKRAREEAEVAAPLPKAAKKPVTPAPLAAVPSSSFMRRTMHRVCTGASHKASFRDARCAHGRDARCTMHRASHRALRLRLHRTAARRSMCSRASCSALRRCSATLTRTPVLVAVRSPPTPAGESRWRRRSAAPSRRRAASPARCRQPSTAS
eukprot:scaffold50187_cov61-Phaeocystis_antarctica.AAC.2